MILSIIKLFFSSFTIRPRNNKAPYETTKREENQDSQGVTQ